MVEGPEDDRFTALRRRAEEVLQDQPVRRIATELRPGILDLSLAATIEWQLQEFQTRYGD